MAAESIGVILAVAGLFSSCIDAFHYFKAGQHFEEDYEILLVKLDIEKTRLLAWGNSVAILDENQRSALFDDRETLEVVQRCLKSIERLLTDSEKLRSYGVRNADMPQNRSIEYLSSNSMNIFEIAYKRFRIRHASSGFRPTLASRAKWAIYEQPKFGQLINDLKDLIDGLYQIMNIGRNTQDDIILADIGLIEDLSQLKLLDAASEGSYRAYSEATKSVIAASEMGTVDQRNPDETPSVVENPNHDSLNNHSQTNKPSSEGDIDSLFAHLINCKKVVVLTDECQRSKSSKSCQMTELGTRLLDYSCPFDIASGYTTSGNALWQLILKFIDIKSKLKSLIEESPYMGTLLQKDDSSLSAQQQEFLEGVLPVATAYIHCAPCVTLIHTASVIAKRASSSFLTILIRPDDRLASSCCRNSDRTEGLRSCLDAIYDLERNSVSGGYKRNNDYLDRTWIEQRLNFIEEERKYDVTEPGESYAIILGEVKYLLPLLQKAPRPRIPRESEIWTLSRSANTRTFLGSFTLRRFATATSATTGSTGSDTRILATPQPVFQRRESFSPPAAKRSRTSTTSTDDESTSEDPSTEIRSE